MMLDESCEGMVHMYSGEQTSVHKAPTSLPVWLYMRQADQRVPDFKKHSSACQSLSRTEECEGGGGREVIINTVINSILHFNGNLHEVG